MIGTKLRGIVLAVMGVAGWHPASASDVTLTPFYRATQLQGHLFGMGLMAIPDYLQASGLAFPYRKKPGMAREIPFADSFVINRVMGGYREDWLRRFNRWDAQLGRRSLDYAVRQADGSLRFRADLIRARLQPYLDAGYQPRDITLALDNVPWDLATPGGGPALEGAWGRKTSPGNLEEWSAVVRQFATDLKAYLGPAAEDIGFETGVEYDEKASFDGSAAAFFAYYAATDHALHAVLPRARLSPGEFTAGGTCVPTNPGCVYDSRDLVAFMRSQHLDPAFVPRSLHALADRPGLWPGETAQRSIESFRRLGPVTEEVHQFGLLFEPFGETLGGDPGPMQADWEFQTLAHLIEGGPPRRVFHWGGFTAVGPWQLLNGSGLLRLVLDHYLGRDVRVLQAREDAKADYPSSVLGLSLAGDGKPALMISSFSPHPAEGTRPVSLTLPATWSGVSAVKVVTYKASDNVFAAIRRDLAADGNLRADFASCALCLGTPQMMGSDLGRVRTLIGHNWADYVALMQRDLRWRTDASVSMAGTRMTAQLEANELMVVEPQ